MSTIKNVCVFCGSSTGVGDDYSQAAIGIANELVDRGIGLVYGGANVGLMGILANTVLQRGGDVTGVIPTFMLEKEVAHTGITDLQIVNSMHERKALMADLSDGFIALPGGFGTIEELFEVLTWSQLELHSKPIGILDTRGYFSSLMAFLHHAVQERFLKPAHVEAIVQAREPALLLDLMESYEPQSCSKWSGLTRVS